MLTLPDFLATLVFEAGVHHLDLVPDLEGAPQPAYPVLSVVRRTLDGLLDAPSPGWDDGTYALKATGRLPLTDADQTLLGAVADRFPLLGSRGRVAGPPGPGLGRARHERLSNVLLRRRWLPRRWRP